MRVAPDHRSERVSQAIFGHVVEVVEISGMFSKVRTPDNYAGWMASAYMTDKPTANFGNSIVTSQLAVFHGDNDERLCLPYGSRLESLGGDRFRAPDGPEWGMFFGRVVRDVTITVPEALAEAQSLISVPYLWGGASSFGYDCSGFTQAVYRRCGVVLPRDSKDQARVGREVSSSEIMPGDLIFFPGHVAIAFSDAMILHSSRLRAGVQFESLDPGHPRFRADLANAVTTTRRIL